MKRPAGIVLIAGLLLIAGLRVLGATPSAGSGPSTVLVRGVELALALISLGTAFTLWRLRSNGVKVYAAWAIAWLLGGATVQVIAEGEPLLHILIWWVVVGAVLAAVGFYLRSELRRTVPHNEVDA
jgi:hypothetical protein